MVDTSSSYLLGKGIHSKSGMVAYQGGVVTGGVGIVIILLCVTSITYIKTMQPRLLEEWIEKGHQRDDTLCGASATRRHPVRCQCTPHSRTLFGEEKRECNQDSCVYVPKGCGGWVFAGVNGVG